MKKMLGMVLLFVTAITFLHAKAAYSGMKSAGGSYILPDIVSDKIYRVMGMGRLPSDLSVIMDMNILPPLAAIAVNPFLQDLTGQNFENMGHGNFQMERHAALDLITAAGLSLTPHKSHNWIFLPRTIGARKTLKDLRNGLSEYYNEILPPGKAVDPAVKLKVHALMINTIGLLLRQIDEQREKLSMVKSAESYLFSFWWVMASMNQLFGWYVDNGVEGRWLRTGKYYPIVESTDSVTEPDGIKHLNDQLKISVLKMQAHGESLMTDLQGSDVAVARLVREFLTNASRFLVRSYAGISGEMRNQLSESPESLAALSAVIDETVHQLDITSEALGYGKKDIVRTVGELKEAASRLGMDQ